MKRSIQHTLGALAAAGLSALLLAGAGAAGGQCEKTDKDRPASPADLPRVQKATHQKYTEKIPDSKVTFEMVPIPGGAFLMGSPPEEKGRGPDEGPQHPVELRPF